MKTPPLYLLFIPVIIFSSCTRRIYVPVESERILHSRDTLRHIMERRDSILLRDSVIIDRRGDTVYHTTVRDRYRHVFLHDTVCRVVRDTVVRTRREPAEAFPKRSYSLTRLWRGLILPAVLALLTAALLLARRRKG